MTVTVRYKFRTADFAVDSDSHLNRLKRNNSVMYPEGATMSFQALIDALCTVVAIPVTPLSAVVRPFMPTFKPMPICWTKW